MKKLIKDLQDRIRHSKELFLLCKQVGVTRFIFLEKPDKEVYDVFFKTEGTNKLPEYTYEYSVYLFMRYIQFYKEHQITSFKFLNEKWKRDKVWLEKILHETTFHFFDCTIKYLKNLESSNDSNGMSKRIFQYTYRISQQKRIK